VALPANFFTEAKVIGRIGLGGEGVPRVCPPEILRNKPKIELVAETCKTQKWKYDADVYTDKSIL